MRELEHAQRSRHADGEPTDADVPERLGPAVGAQEHVRRRGCRRRLAAFVSGDFTGSAIVRRRIEQHERPAADPRRLRLDERQDELHRDRRIHGAAAGAQDRTPGFGGMGIRGDDELRVRAHWRRGLRRDAADGEGGNRRGKETA